MHILFPEFKEGLLYYGNDTEEQLRRNLNDTFISTAVESTVASAKESSLHEIDTILPKSKDKNEQVFWSGVLGISLKDENDEVISSSSNGYTGFKRFTENKPEIIVGGDSRYGLGRVKLESCTEMEPDELLKWQINEEGLFVYDEKEAIKNMISTEGTSLIEGRYKTIIQFSYNSSKGKPIMDEQNINLCFLPGSKVKTNGTSHILEKGMLKRQNMNSVKK